MASTAVASSDMAPQPRVKLDLDPADLGAYPHLFPNASVESDLTNIATVLANGAGTLTRSTTASVTPYGLAFARLQFTTATTTIQGGIRNRAQVVPGRSYTFNAWAKLLVGASQQMRVEIDWRNAADVQIGSTVNGTTAAVTTGAGVTLTAAAATAPALADHVYLRVVAAPTGRLWAVGDVLAVDAWSDGPYVEIPTDTVTIWQVSKWGQVAVTDGERIFAPGGVIVTDYALPTGVPVTYKVEKFDANGTSLGYSAWTATVQVDIPDGYAVISDPLAPGNAVLVWCRPTFGEAINRQRPLKVYQAGDKSIALAGMRSLMVDINLQVKTETIEQAETLDLVCAESLILVRIMPSGGLLPGAFYAALSTSVAAPIDVQFGGGNVEWPLHADEVSRPSVGIVVPVFTYQVFKDYLVGKYGAGATYANAAAEWATYAAAIRNPPTV